MNWNMIEGKWKEVSGTAKEQWGMLRDDELQQIDGKKDKLEGLIQQRYGVTQEEAARQIDDWAAGLKKFVNE